MHCLESPTNLIFQMRHLHSTASQGGSESSGVCRCHSSYPGRTLRAQPEVCIQKLKLQFSSISGVNRAWTSNLMKNNSASFLNNAEQHNLLTEMRTVLFLFLNPTQRTTCSLPFQTQQSFGGYSVLRVMFGQAQ